MEPFAISRFPPVFPTTAPAKEIPPQDASKLTLIVGVYFGSKTTSVSYLALPDQTGISYPHYLDNIKTIQNWGHREVKDHVPNEISYSLSPGGYAQWGYDIDDKGVTTRDLRDGLEEADDRTRELADLLSFISTPRRLGGDRFGPFPIHLAKTADQKVIDFLTHIAEKTRSELRENIGRRVLEGDHKTLDFAFSYPQWWTERTKRRYYRVIESVFNSEPFPVLRHIYLVQELHASLNSHIVELFREDRISFRRGDCFIVCEADKHTQSILYRVESVDIHSQKAAYSRVGDLSFKHTGTPLVDKAFMNLVHQRLSPEDSRKLSGSPGERRLLDRFAAVRHSFDGRDNGLSISICLPRGIGSVNDLARGIWNGALFLTVEDLKRLFAEALLRLEDLICGHISSAFNMNSPLKIAFMSGSFAEIPYVFERLRSPARERGIEVERLTDVQTAVSRGCVIHATGVVSIPPKPVVKIGHNLGVIICEPFRAKQHGMTDLRMDPVNGSQQAKGQIKWLIDKNDPIFPDDGPRYESLQLIRRFWQQDQADGKSSKVILVTSKTDPTDRRSSRFVDLKVEDRILNVEYKLADIPSNEVKMHETVDASGTKSHYYQVSLHVDLYVELLSFKVKLRCGSGVLAEVTEQYQ